MKNTFENDNNGIVYAPEKITSHTGTNCYTFITQWVWWLASIIGREPGLIIHIDNLGVRANIRNKALQAVSSVPRDIEVKPRLDTSVAHIHPDGVIQIRDSSSDCSDSEKIQLDSALEQTE